MTEEAQTQEHLRRDWVGLLAPTLLAVVVTLAIQVGGYVWFMATLNQRTANNELRLKVAEDALSKIPKDYVSREDLVKSEQTSRDQRREDQSRFDRVEAKIDLILERGK